MKHLKYLLLLLLAAGTLLEAVEIKTPFMTAELSPGGATITSLKVGKSMWRCIAEKNGSFTDRILQNLTPNLQGLAETAKILYELKEYKRTPAGTRVTFSSCIGVIPGLRMEKSYFFSAKKPLIKVEYRFTNIGSKPFPLALYTRVFLSSGSGKSFYYHPGANGIEKILPGETTVAKKCPELTFLAVADETGAGFIQHYPADDTAGVLNWILKDGYTQEYLSSQQLLAPGKTRVIQWECRYAPDVKAALEKTALRSRKLKGEIPVQVDRICGIKPKAKLQFFRSIPTPEKSFIDCTFRRQFEESWRAVELPPAMKSVPIAVYKVENGITATDSPLPFIRRGNSIVICVPGISPGTFIYPESCSLKDDFLHWRSMKKWFGPLTMKCRILFDAGTQKEVNAPDIPAGGALIRNGSMEISSAKNKNLPAFLSYKDPGLKLEAAEGGKAGKFLRVKRYLMYAFLPEYQKEYHLSLRARAAGGTGLTRIFIQFYDKKGKYLQKERRIVYAGKNSFDWKKIDHRFYVPDHVAFLRLLVINGSGKGQYIDIDDLQLTLSPQKQQSVDRKQMLRDEMLKLWNIPLPLLENISHELVTPHVKWFKPAAHPVKNVLFISNVTGRIVEGKRRNIVEYAQRLDLQYTHIPLIRKIKSVVSAYSVYPTYFENKVSEYTMACLKEIKELPEIFCLLGINFKTLKDDEFISLLVSWQKKGVNFIFIDCAAPPPVLVGKYLKQDFAPLLPVMSNPPNGRPNLCRFTRNHNATVAIAALSVRSCNFIPDNQRFEAQYYTLPYAFEFPWWEYNNLFYVQLLRHMAKVPVAAKLVKTPSFAGIKAQKEFNGTLEIKIESMSKELLLSQKRPVKVPAGKTLELPDDFSLPGGIFVANLRLLDAAGRAVDAGAVKLERKEITPLTVTLKNKENIVPHPQKAEFTVKAPRLPAGAAVSVEIFNQRGEILFRSAPRALKELSFAVELPRMRTFYNYIRSRVTQGERLLATVTQEFSVPGIPLAMNEFYGFTNPASSSSAIKDIGFDFSIAGDPRWKHTPARIRLIRTMGLIPIPRRGDEKMFRPYRDDVKTAPVRTPCFTSPEFHAQLQKDTKFMAENCKFRYNDVNHLWAGDEMFLGRSVCTSPSCLAGFRKKMEKSFGKIEALNENWGTNFKNFAEVHPKQLNELKDKNRLGAWLDHKMYMTEVFAENFFGKAKTELEKYVPNVKIGPTGTQKPGFGYNWHELMKYCRIVGYYSGVQTKVIHDLADSTLMAGQCGGGYTHGHIDYEPYNYDTMWRTLLNGGNLAYHYHGASIKSDGSLTDNMRYYSNSLRELKSGIGKLYLSAQPRFDVALLYSQPSLFAAMGSCGQDEWQNSQTSWAKLLEDLRVSARFINYEELAEKGVPAGIKVLILPFTLALSDKEAASLERFAARGGVVIADRDAGIFDGHGRKRSEKERLEKLKFVKTLDFSIARYNFVQSGGVGGEVSSSFSGDKKFIDLCRTRVKNLLAEGKVTSFVELRDAQGREFGCTAKFRQDGPTKIYGFHEPAGVTPGRFKDMKAVKVTVKLPEKGHIFEVRSKRYIGHTDSFEMPLIPGWSMIYAVMPVKPEQLKVTLPGTVECGKSFETGITLSPAKGPQVFRVMLFSRDGREMKQFSANYRFEDGSGKVEFFIPHNFKKGKYTVKAVHTATGIKGTKSLEIR